ncbi:ATP-binding protein [Candidatus Bipolaricaulota bacterium]
MNPSPGPPVNCWQFLDCDFGPDSAEPCLVTHDTTSDGINRGENGGRSCWELVGVLSGSKDLAPCAQEENCLTCDFLRLVKSDEGPSFQLLKLARGVRSAAELQRTIAQVESFMSIHERLRSHFDLEQTVSEITEEARKVTGAQRASVLLIKGRPPELRGRFELRGEDREVAFGLDESTAAGFSVVNNQIVNLRDIYDAEQGQTFNRDYDRQFRCRTDSFLAAPVCDSVERVIGVITLANARKGFFSPDDEWFVEKYAIEVALAVEKQKFIQQSLSTLRLAAIDETVAGLSHCIKNIAQALRAGSHIIKRALRQGNLQDIRAAWDILDRHIERLADLSMVVLAYDPVVKEHSSGAGLNKLAEHVVNLFREEARARSIEIRLSKGEGVDSVRFDAMEIYRCLVNLISNALDACPLSEGVVCVSTGRTAEKEVYISVSDNGRGIDDKTKETIFELFRTSKPERGAGLGLATVAGIVDKLDGRLDVDSSLGEGATFRVFFGEDTALG